MLDSSLQMDQIRCTDTWRGQGSRYDYVLIKSHDEELIYAQVMGLFRIKVGDNTHDIGLISELKRPARHHTSNFIHASPPEDFRFVFTATFVRSILVHPPGSSNLRTKFVVNDLLDSDMYLRLQCV
jgi:hypothetical protein